MPDTLSTALDEFEIDSITGRRRKKKTTLAQEIQALEQQQVEPLPVDESEYDVFAKMRAEQQARLIARGELPEPFIPVIEPPRPDITESTDLLKRLYPEMFQPGYSYGIKEEDLPFEVAKSLLMQAQERTDDFLEDLLRRGTPEDVGEMLRTFGLSQQDIDSIFGAEQRQSDLEKLVKASGFQDYTLEDFGDLIDEESDKYDFDKFIERMQTGGATSEKRQLLTTLGFTPEQINEILARQKIVAPVEGIRKLVTFDGATNRAFDEEGNFLGVFNPITRDIRKQTLGERVKDFADAWTLASIGTWERTKQFGLTMLPDIFFRTMSFSERKSYGDDWADQVDSNNKQLRDTWRKKAAESQIEYEDYIKGHKEMQPRPDYEEGASVHPELWKDPGWWAYEVASVVPNTVASMAVTALVTGLTGGNLLLGAAAGGVVQYPLEAMGVREDLLAEGVPEDQAEEIAKIAAVPIVMLESAGRLPVMLGISPVLKKMFTKEAIKQVTRLTIRQLAKKGFTTFTSSQFGETITEVLQEAVGNAAAKIAGVDRRLFENTYAIATKTFAGVTPFSLIGAGGAVSPQISQAVSEGIQNLPGGVKTALKGERGSIQFPESLERRDKFLMDKALEDNKVLIDEEIKKAGNREVGMKVAADRLEKQVDPRTGVVNPENIKAAELIRKAATLEVTTPKPPQAVPEFGETVKPELPIPEAKPPVTPEVTTKATITQTELGGIKYIWVRLEGRPSVNIGRVTEGLSRELLIERAKNYWAYEDKVRTITSNLREKYNKQVYVGTLPTQDVATDLAGNYAYVLKDRKKGGKFQVEEAVSLEAGTPEVAIPKAEVTLAPEVTEANAELQRIIDKWSASKTRNAPKAEADLAMLGKRGFEITDAKDALQEYKDTVRADFDTAEEFSEAKTDAWENFTGELDSIERKEIPAAEVTPITPTAPAVEIPEAEAEALDIMLKEPIKALPEPKAEEVAELEKLPSRPRYTLKQIDVLVSFFADYILSPNAMNAWTLTRELRRETNAQKAESLKNRARELVVEAKKGEITFEQALKQAISESLKGEMPTATTEFFEGMTSDLRDALFAKVYYVLRNDSFEQASTVTALVNAIGEPGKPGRAIPRERPTPPPGGFKSKIWPQGASAWDKLNYVFGERPKVLKAIEKMAEEGKSLKDVVEGVYRETVEGGNPPIPIDQETADYLRRLKEIPMGEPRLGEQPFILPDLPVDTRTSAQKTIDLQKFKLELTPDIYKGWTPERLETLSFLRINLLKADYQARLVESGFIPPKPLATDTRTPAQKAIDLEIFKIELAPGPVQIAKYEAPIEKEFKQKPLLPRSVQENIIDGLRQLALAPVDFFNGLRSIKASIDQSFALRQLLFILPGIKGKIFNIIVNSWKAGWSTRSALASKERITRKLWFQIYEKGVSEGHGDPLRFRGIEEFGFVGESPRWIPKIFGAIPTTAWSERNYVTGINEGIAVYLDAEYDVLLRKGEKIAAGEMKAPKDGYNLEAEFFDQMDYLANITGRATIGKLTPDSTLLQAVNALFFSARFKLGRFLTPIHLLGLNKVGKDAHFSHRVMRNAWRDIGTTFTAISSLIALGVIAGWWETEKDPANPNLIKIRIGNTRIDPWGGMQQVSVFLYQIFSKRAVSSVTGAEYEPSLANSLFNMVEKSGSPLMSAMMELYTGETFTGEKVDLTNAKQWTDRIAPFMVQDIYDYIIEGGRKPAVAIPIAILGWFGAGILTYTGDWVKDWQMLGMSKYPENLLDGLSEPPYDVKDFWGEYSGKFKGVDPASLTEKKGYPPYIKDMVEAGVIKEYLESLPSERLVSLNADPSKGAIFGELRDLWNQRQALVDAGDDAEYKENELQPDGTYKEVTHKGDDAVTAFDKHEFTFRGIAVKGSQSYNGNFSPRQFALLKDYWMITDKKKQATFLEEHKAEIGVKPRDEYLRTHAKENAQLARWGQLGKGVQKILTQEAYDEAQRQIKALGMPDNAVSQYLPPREIAPTLFKRQDIVSEFGANSWEDKLLRASPEGKKFVEWQNKSDPDNALGEIDIPIASLKLKTESTYRGIYNKLNKEDDPDWIGNLDDAKKDDVVGSPTFGLTARQIASNKYNDTKIPGTDLTYRDMERKVTAIEKGTDEKPIDPKIIDAYVAQKRIADTPGRGANSAESMLARVDDSALNAFLTDKNIWGKDALEPIDESQIPIWRLQKQDREYTDTLELYKTKTLPDGTPNPDYKDDKIIVKDGKTAREIAVTEHRENNLIAVDDERRIEVYKIASNVASSTGKPFIPADPAIVEAHVENGRNIDKPGIGPNSAEVMLSKIDLTGAVPKLNAYGQWRLDNKLDTEVPDMTRIPVWKIDKEFRRQDTEYEAIDPDDDAAQKSYLQWNKDYAIARLKRDGYNAKIPEPMINTYVEWRGTERKGYEDDWFLQEHEGFYKKMVKLGVMERRDWRLTPTREIHKKYLVYKNEIIGRDNKLVYRLNNLDLDKWLVLTKQVARPIDEEAEMTDIGTMKPLTDAQKRQLRQREIEQRLADLLRRSQ